MSAIDTKVATVGDVDLTPAVDFLAAHPHLPTPRGLDVGRISGALSISAFVDTAEQVHVWADAIGSDVSVTPYQGNTHHHVYTFNPFYVSITAIVPGVSA